MTRSHLVACIVLFICLPLPARSMAGGETEPPKWEFTALDDSTYLSRFELEPMVVTGSRTPQRLADVTVATELIRREDLERSGASNLADFLEKQPGIVITHSIFGNGIQLQGLGSEYVLVLVNGERVLGRKGGILDLSRFASDNVERIEVVKGNQSALYGSDAIGGVINIITRGSLHPLEFDFHSDLAGSSRLDLGGSLGYKGDSWTSRVTGSWDETEAYDIRPSDPETSVDGYAEFSLSNHNEWRLTESAVLNARSSYLSRDQEGIDGGTAGSPAIFDRRNNTEIFTLSVGPDIHLQSGSHLRSNVQFSYYLDQYLHDQRDSNVMDQYQETRQRLLHANLQYDRLLPGSQLLSAGMEVFQEWIETERLIGGEGDRERFALFLQDQWEIGDEGRFKLIGGLRFDRDSQFGNNVTPKLSVRGDLSKRLILRAGVGKGFRAPDFKELYIYFSHPAVGYVVHGNPNLKPESSRSGNLGLEWRSGQGVWFSVSAFYHSFDNLIQGLLSGETEGGLQLANYVNVATATIQGLEANLQFRPLPVLNCELAYAYLDSRDESTGSILDGRPSHRGSVSLDLSFPKLSADLLLRGSVVGERSFSHETSGVATTRTDPYALLDLKLRKSLGGFLTLSTGINNLLDAGDHEYLRVAPRRYHVGFSIKHVRSKTDPDLKTIPKELP